MPRLAEDDRALLRSQSGPLAGMSFSTVPARIDSQAFRVLLLRLLRLPLPLSSRRCRCGLFWYGHHRASCATAGVLGRRGFAVENAAARITKRPTGRHVSRSASTDDSQAFRVLLLRLLRLPLPLSSRRCRCGRFLVWPPSSIMCDCRGSGQTRVCGRECCCTNMPRGRRQGVH